MSLVAGRGPLGKEPAGRFTPPIPAGVVYIEPHPRRIKAVKGGRTVIDTERAHMVHRAGRPLSYVFPAEIVTDLPAEPEPQAPGYVHVPWDTVDDWFEEGRKLVHYPPNPYHRVDCRPTTRRLRVTLEDSTLVDTDDTMIVFETSVPPRLYVAPQHVRTELLHRTETSSYCNYKGYATYWAPKSQNTDIAWSYEDPLPETRPIKGFLSFDAAKVQVEAELPEA
ncbi:DUF427 domain-containing protein [Mycobacterium vicinigordonae]|uniref:DUF427 domain-containing protein n=1 Tax=Mycobacterium vicinigordonae TaxID=1719132 RepID=A0A7D6DYG6_9MYCO|nr:DUF427 domain-containing protein [Mycobacterium vicinigordonae]QLL07824.1 DUF427 domain-containing protein [Mycobacterium vicinigordonae]